MSTVNKFGTARFLDPANAQFRGQERVNAEIFTAMEILGRKLERSESERDRLARRLALIESAATVDEKTGRLYLPVVMAPAHPPRVADRAAPKWMAAVSLMSSLIAVVAISIVLFRNPVPNLTKEQLAVLDAIKSYPSALPVPEDAPWGQMEEAPQFPSAADIPETGDMSETGDGSKSAGASAIAAIAPGSSETAAEKTPEAQPVRSAETGAVAETGGEDAVPDVALSEDEIEASPPGATENKVDVRAAAGLRRSEAPASPRREADLPPDPALPAVLAQLEKRAYQGIPEAQHDMAALYASGKLAAQNHQRAIYWFGKAAEGGVANAHYNLGVIYQRGLGVEPDMPKALSWYIKAAELGHPEALYNLGVIHIEGDGAEMNIEKGVSYFKRAAQAGVTQAAYNLGVLYESNFMGAIDIAKAVEWYQVAAAKGHAEARSAIIRLNGAADQALTLANTVEPAAGELDR